VGKEAFAVQKAEHGQNRNANNGAALWGVQFPGYKLPNDFNPIYLVAVECRCNEHRWPRNFGALNNYGNFNLGGSVKLRDAKIDRPAFAQGDALVENYNIAFFLFGHGYTFRSIYFMIEFAMSFPVAASIPSRPGEEFTSRISGPRADCSISTPAIPRPMAFAAFRDRK